MIAGTYTPFLVVKIGGLWGTGLLIYVWAVAGTGMAMKLLAVQRFERFSTALYLFLGTIIVAIVPLLSSLAAGNHAAGDGGLLYSIGVIFYLWEQLAYQQAIWHGLVIAAAGCHYAAIMGEIVLAGGCG